MTLLILQAVELGRCLREMTARMRDTVVAAALLVSSGVALGGCGKDEPAAAPPSATDSAASTNTASPMGTPDASATTTPGAKQTEEQFVARWVDSYNTMLSTGDTGQFLALATSRCESCLAVSRSVRGFYADGGSMTGGELHNLRGLRPSGTWDRQPRYVFVVDARASEALDKNGETVRSFPISRGESYNIVLMPVGRTWKVIHVGKNPI